MGLGTKTNGTTLLHRAQTRQSLCCCCIYALIVCYSSYDFSPCRIFDLDRRDHIAPVKCSIIFKRLLVLLIAEQGNCILLLRRDSGFTGDVLRCLEHGIGSKRVKIEIIPYPVFILTFATRAKWIGVIDMRPVARFVTRDSQYAALPTTRAEVAQAWLMVGPEMVVAPISPASQGAP